VAGEFTLTTEMLTTEILCLEDGLRTTIYQPEPGTRGHDAMTLLSMVADAPGLPH
jgi:hypothetical protein